MKRKLLAVMLLLFGLVANSQTASIRGTVVDPSKALIPGVTVIVQNIENGETRTTLTNESGQFTFAGLTPGKFKLTASLPGFQTRVTEVQLVSGTVDVQLMLSLASVNTSVEVSASPGALMTSSAASVGQVLSAARGVVTDTINRGPAPMNTESYDYIDENQFTRVSTRPLSTFAVDVDTASYTNVRRFLTDGKLPPKDAVRIEELVNYFKYDYSVSRDKHPIAIHTEVAPAFWEPKHRLVRIGIRANDVDLSARSRANLVFLIDVSGSMMSPEKLPLVQSSLHLLVDQLREDDTVSMVVYAGSSGLVLPATEGKKKKDIHSAIDRLVAGGSTNGGAGIELAYRVAAENFVPGGINRVILATDGDFNVGVTNNGDLVRLIQDKAQSGVFLSVFGFGVGNYNDSTLEKLADKGHGNYGYIDTIAEAKRAFVDQLTGNLMTVAKDVKLQIEFNPAEVEAYRLIGYENRVMADQDFRNDKKMGGDMGAGHNVTAFFEIVPKGAHFDGQEATPLRYQKQAQGQPAQKGELLTVSVRYKLPEATESVLLEVPAMNATTAFENASKDFRFASSVASFGMLLRDSPNRGTASIEDVVRIASDTAGIDTARTEFVGLARKTATKLHKKER